MIAFLLVIVFGVAFTIGTIFYGLEPDFFFGTWFGLTTVILAYLVILNKETKKPKE